MKKYILIVLAVITAAVILVSCKNSSTSPPDDSDGGGGIRVTADPGSFFDLSEVRVSDVTAYVYDSNGDGIEGVSVNLWSADPVVLRSVGGNLTTDANGEVKDRVYIYGLLDGYCDVEIVADLSNGVTSSALIGIDDCVSSVTTEMKIIWFNENNDYEGAVVAGESITLVIINISNSDADCDYQDTLWTWPDSTDSGWGEGYWTYAKTIPSTVSGDYIVKADVRFTGTGCGTVGTVETELTRTIPVTAAP